MTELFQKADSRILLIMFPLLWRYLIKNYLEVCLLSVVAFIAILLTSRLEEIARFASFGANPWLIGLFALFQIPYILPIAIPVGCLISSILLMQRLSKNHELTALRSAGLSIKSIISPILLTSILIAIFNFYSASELATASHLKANLLKNKLFSINPLLLLNNKHLMRMKGFYYDSLGPSKMGQSASDALIAVPNQGKGSLNLILASQLESTDQDFKTKQLSIIAPITSDQEIGFQNMLLETVGEAVFSIQDFANLIQKKVYQASNDSLTMGLLLIRLKDLKHQLVSFEDPEEIKATQKSIRQLYSEIARRISAGLSPITFTLLGLAFGMSVSRMKNSFQLIFPIGLAATYLVCFFAAKAMESKVLISYLLYLAPHLVIIAASLRKISKINRGIG